ncbi:MAG: adenosine deaminase [Chloroflexota bacterium]
MKPEKKPETQPPREHLSSHPLSSEMAGLIREMPKAEIHIHLEGAIQPEVVLTLAERHDMMHTLPASDVEGLSQWFTFTDFPHFVEIYFAISNLLRTADDFAAIAYACGQDMAAQNIRYRELTVTPYTHTSLQKKEISIDDILDGLSRGREKAKADLGVEMCWVFDIPRNLAFRHDTLPYDPKPAETTLEYALLGQSAGVVGFGLGGYEVGAPPEPFAHAFRAARQAGLHSVPHAGETMGADSIWGAIRELGAERIGHGVRAIEDPALLHHLQEHQITLEVNPTSNICLHVYRRHAEHPFPHLDKMGIPVTINSDDPPLFNTTLCAEYEVLNREFGYNGADLARIARYAFVAAHVPTEIKTRLLTEFDQWVESNIDGQKNSVLPLRERPD